MNKIVLRLSILIFICICFLSCDDGCSEDENVTVDPTTEQIDYNAKMQPFRKDFRPQGNNYIYYGYDKSYNLCIIQYCADTYAKYIFNSTEDFTMTLKGYYYLANPTTLTASYKSTTNEMGNIIRTKVHNIYSIYYESTYQYEFTYNQNDQMIKCEEYEMSSSSKKSLSTTELFYKGTVLTSFIKTDKNGSTEFKCLYSEPVRNIYGQYPQQLLDIMIVDPYVVALGVYGKLGYSSSYLPNDLICGNDTTPIRPVVSKKYGFLKKIGLNEVYTYIDTIGENRNKLPY